MRKLSCRLSVVEVRYRIRIETSQRASFIRFVKSFWVKEIVYLFILLYWVAIINRLSFCIYIYRYRVNLFWSSRFFKLSISRRKSLLCWLSLPSNTVHSFCKQFCFKEIKFLAVYSRWIQQVPPYTLQLYTREAFGISCEHPPLYSCVPPPLYWWCHAAEHSYTIAVVNSRPPLFFTYVVGCLQYCKSQLPNCILGGVPNKGTRSRNCCYWRTVALKPIKFCHITYCVNTLLWVKGWVFIFHFHKNMP